MGYFRWILVIFLIFVALFPLVRVIVDTGLITKDNQWLILSWYIMAGIISTIINLLLDAIVLLHKAINGGK